MPARPPTPVTTLCNAAAVRLASLVLVLAAVGCMDPHLPSDDFDTDAFDEIEGPFAVGDTHLARVVWVPSAAADPEGIVVRLVYPTPAEARYGDGLPVVVEVPGGTDAGGIGVPGQEIELAFPGIVHVKITLPGGGNGDWTSGGQADRRGADSVQSLGDVLRFVLGGRLEDGRTLDDLVGAIDRGAVGVLGVSNGGNLVAAALGTQSDLDGLCWAGLWESPITDSFATVDLGSRKSDLQPVVDADGNGIPWDDYMHPSYVPGICTASVGCALDWGPLGWDGETLFRDGNEDGILGDGDGTTDLDGNGQITLEEDFAYGWFADDVERRFYSAAVTRAASRELPFPDGWPDWVASLDEADVYWEPRSGLPLLQAATQRLPELHVLILAEARDHVQAAPDHPHVQLAYDVSRSGFAWVRLNPDRSYLLPAANAGDVPAPENRAGAPIDGAEIHQQLVPPQPTTLASALLLAASAEMSDRCHLDVWDDDLETALVQVPRCPACEP